MQRHAEAVASKHQVSLIHVISDKNLIDKKEIQDFTINNVRTIIIYVKSSSQLLKLYRFFAAYLFAIKMIGYFDMVHLNVTYPKGMVALYLKWFKNKPYIISEHWTHYQFPLNKSIGFVQKWITKIIIKNAAFVCPVSAQLKSAMINYGLKGNYYPIPNIVDTTRFKVSENHPSGFTITHVSHMGNTHKNVTGILHVFAKIQSKIPEICLNLIGDNSKQYWDLIHTLNIKNIQVIDQIPNAEVAKYLSESDLLVLFSNYENLPCIILEAFSCGTPVISTNVGGISEYFPAEFGKLIEPKDELALENAILQIYHSTNKPDKNKMHQYAIDNFGTERICHQFSGLYDISLQKKSQ